MRFLNEVVIFVLGMIFSWRNMMHKILLIDSRPEEVQNILKESFGKSKAILLRKSLEEALPDLSNHHEVTLILTKLDSLKKVEKKNNAHNNGHQHSSSSLQLTNAEFPELIGKSERIRNVCRRIAQVASTDSTVLIEGESGTGKELVARAIYYHSRRVQKPFIKVNCAALSETLIESELFGHVRGAFTGAVRDRKGRFAEGDGGTILLDEIGAMPIASQAKFLRVLQEGEFESVGSSTNLKVDVRVVATHNSSLVDAVHKGTFREDLYYRLCVFPIIMPSLKEREEDIPLLVEHFLRKYSHLNREVVNISSESLEICMDYKWPGNIRQLENAIQHALIVETTDTIKPQSLPFTPDHASIKSREEGQQLPLREKLNLYEKRLILEALTHSKGVKNKAALLLGVNPKNLSHLLNKHQL
jgi:transcriptional regulator with PAS, ATPase and Fis domain